MKSSINQRVMRFTAIAIRICLGVLFVWSGAIKILHPYQFVQNIEQYKLVNISLATWIAIILPWLEFCVGICMLTGILIGGAILVGAALCSVFIFVNASASVRGISIGCGCFGSGNTTGTVSLSRAIAMLVSSVVVYWLYYRLSNRRVGNAMAATSSIHDLENKSETAHSSIASVIPTAPKLILCLVSLVCWSVAAHAATAAKPNEDPASIDAKLAKIVAAHANESAMQEYLQRLKLVDEVCDKIISRFEAFRSEALKKLLDKTLNAPTSAPARAQAQTSADLIAEYNPTFASALPEPQVTPAELQTLRDVYVQKIESAARHLADRGHMAFISDKDPDAIGLALVLPFLHINDSAWNAQQTANLPTWISSPANRPSLEQFALKVRRPFTAYQFSAQNSKDQNPEDVISYMRSTADRLIRSGDRANGVYLLQTAVEVAAREHQFKLEIDARFRLAEVLHDMDQSAAAAEVILQVLEHSEDAPAFSRAALLRIKYLYESGQFDRVLQSTNVLKKDPRCDTVLPQILYIEWTAKRQSGQDSAGEKAMRDEFLKLFPDHPLGADMYFATAMTSLASGEYDEAQRILEYIEYRYPNSKLLSKVKQIEQQLSKNVQQVPTSAR